MKPFPMLFINIKLCQNIFKWYLNLVFVSTYRYFEIEMERKFTSIGPNENPFFHFASERIKFVDDDL